MKLTLIRTSTLPFVTMGTVYFTDGDQLLKQWYSIEGPWRDGNKGRSSIKSGKYGVELSENGKIRIYGLDQYYTDVLRNWKSEIIAEGDPRKIKDKIAIGTEWEKTETGPELKQTSESKSELVELMRKAKIESITIEIIKL